MPNLFLGFPVSRSKFAEFAASAVTSLYAANEIFFHTMFKSLDGWAAFTAAPGTVAMDVNKIKLHTGGAIGGLASIIEQLQFPIGATTWNKPRKFKTKVRVDHANDASSQIFICTGDEAAGLRGFGFRYQNTKLIGQSCNGGAYATVDLITGLVAPYSRTELLEARFTPGSKIDFYVDNVFKGSINAQLPTGTTDAEKLLKYMVYAQAAVDHLIWTSEAKFSQNL